MKSSEVAVPKSTKALHHNKSRNRHFASVFLYEADKVNKSVQTEFQLAPSTNDFGQQTENQAKQAFSEPKMTSQGCQVDIITLENLQKVHILEHIRESQELQCKIEMQYAERLDLTNLKLKKAKNKNLLYENQIVRQKREIENLINEMQRNERILEEHKCHSKMQATLLTQQNQRIK